EYAAGAELRLTGGTDFLQGHLPRVVGNQGGYMRTDCRRWGVERRRAVMLVTAVVVAHRMSDAVGVAMVSTIAVAVMPVATVVVVMSVAMVLATVGVSTRTGGRRLRCGGSVFRVVNRWSRAALAVYPAGVTVLIVLLLPDRHTMFDFIDDVATGQ